MFVIFIRHRALVQGESKRQILGLAALVFLAMNTLVCDETTLSLAIHPNIAELWVVDLQSEGDCFLWFHPTMKKNSDVCD